MTGNKRMEPIQENKAEIVDPYVDALNRGKLPIILGTGEFRHPKRERGPLARSYPLEPALV